MLSQHSNFLQRQLLVVTQRGPETDPIWEHFERQKHDCFTLSDFLEGSKVPARPYYSASLFSVEDEILPQWSEVFGALFAKIIPTGLLNIHVVLSQEKTAEINSVKAAVGRHAIFQGFINGSIKSEKQNTRGLNVFHFICNKMQLTNIVTRIGESESIESEQIFLSIFRQ